MKSSLAQRVAGAVAALALGCAVAAVPTSAQADAADSSGAWLADELDGGLIPGQFGSPDYGLSIDALISLDLLGVESDAVDDIIGALAKDPQAYISGEAFGDADSTYAGATAKLAVGAATAGRTPESFGGVDLVERLRSTVKTDGAEAGRGIDVSTFGDYSNTLGQTFVVRALVEAGDDLAVDAVDYLLKQQCDTGAFRINLFAEAKPDDPETDYDDSVAATDRECGDPTTPGDDTISYDATALAVSTLVEASDAGLDGLDGAIAAGADALAAAQGSDGSLKDDGASNTNTTGLAAVALADAGDLAAARDAALFVESLRVPDDSTGALAQEKGAIAFDRAAYGAAEANGIAARDQWRRATAQAAGALALLPSSAKITVGTDPAGFAGTGQQLEVTASGLEPQEPVTVTAADASVNGTATDAGRVVVDLTMPSTEGTVTVTVQGATDDRVASTRVRVLAPAEFDVTVPDEVMAGKPFSVDVDGLVEGEAYEATFEKVADAAEGDEAPVAASRALPSGGLGAFALATIDGLVAPTETGEYTLTITSVVPERGGSTTVTVVAADAPAGAGTGTGGSGAVADAGDTLPDAGTTVPLALLLAALAALVVGLVLVLRRRGGLGEHR